MKEFFKQHQLVLATIIFSAAFFITGSELSRQVSRFQNANRKVVVKGLAERDVPANKVTWPLIFKEIGNDPAEMYRLMDQKNQQVVSFLKEGGLKADEITINPPTINDRQADNYGNEIMNFRYRATGVITVTSTNVDLVRQLMARQSELMKNGIAIVHEDYGSNTVRYEFTSLNDIKPAMVEEATHNARETAQKFAADSDCALGEIRTATQGQFSIEDRDPNTPYIKHVRVVTTIEYSLK
ncbi:MAG: SIMPL domain-containing protein [Bacteroidaceae bacterium]|nr:SIMPL domain-containing protein [Bacteroidaceae bacterium]